jgi:hypothetical protein
MLLFIVLSWIPFRLHTLHDIGACYRVMFVPYLGDGVSPWLAHCPRAGVALPSSHAAPQRLLLAVARRVDPLCHRLGS